MNIVITGSSRGLGKYLTEYYLAKDHLVYGCGRSATTVDHPNYIHTTLNLAEENQVRKWINGVRKNCGQIDVLICNAALVSSALYLSLTPGNLFQSFVQSNFAGAFYTMREVSKQMIRQGTGRIVAISSITTATHQEGTSIYTATKSALNEMVKVLAKEVAKNNVTCNIVAPGMMKTEASEAMSENAKWTSEMLEKQDIKRIIEKREVAHTVDFLLSPLSKSITGQIFYLGLVD